MFNKTNKIVNNILGHRKKCRIGKDKFSRNYSFGKLTKEQEHQVDCVNKFDHMCQQTNSPFEKQLEQIYDEAGTDASGYGWAGIAYNKPQVFKKAYVLAKKNMW